MSTAFQPLNLALHRLPDELLVDILKRLVSDEIPSKKLAIVCKRWKTLLLRTSIFWRKISASFVQDDQAALHSIRLRRRLELSQSAQIDVTLNVSEFRDDYSKILFEILATADLKRWRSLKLEPTRQKIPVDCIAGLFAGSFTSLRSLYLEKTMGDDPYTPIYELIAQSPPVLTFLYSDKQVPDLLLNGRVLRKVTELAIPASFYGEVAKKASIASVHLISTYIVNPSLIPPLAKRVEMTHISNEVLAELDLSRVQDLQLFCYADWRGEAKIQLPSLLSLVLSKSVRFVTLFNAPLLVSLKLGHVHDNLGEKDKIAESRKILELFTKDHDQISMAPTSLDIHLNITEAAAIAILLHWHQVQHLTLDLTSKNCFALEGAFAKGLKSVKRPLCPNLITLVLRTPWDKKESDRWLRTAGGMLKARSLGPLELFSWTREIYQSKTTVIITREDIDGV